MTAFAAAAAVLRSDPNGSEDGTFAPATGTSTFGAAEACRLQFTTGSEAQTLEGVPVWNPGVQLVVYHAGLSRAPAQGDRVIARGTTYRVTAIRGADGLGPYWSRCDVDPDED